MTETKMEKEIRNNTLLKSAEFELWFNLKRGQLSGVFSQQLLNIYCISSQEIGSRGKFKGFFPPS